MLQLLNCPKYVSNVKFYSFLRHQTQESYANTNFFQNTKTSSQLHSRKQMTRPISTYQLKKQELQQYAREKNDFRGYLKSSGPFKQEALAEDQENLEVQKLFHDQEKKQLPKSRHKMKFRNNNLLFEMQQKELKKLQFQKFINGEKQYFTQLNTLQDEGKQNFHQNAEIRQVLY